MVGRFDIVKQGDLCGNKAGVHALRSRRGVRTGVRASIVARKPGNSGGAKGRRKVDS